jgi:signal transduction histidine kinase
MDHETLEYFSKLGETIAKDNWKSAIDSLVVGLRKRFVFDNLAIFLAENVNGIPEVVYARAVGRGRSKEADASWGEEIANQVISKGKIVVVAPSRKSNSDRTAMVHLLGLPLPLSVKRGALLLVRFGGPEYSADQLPLAVLAATLVSRVVERRRLQDYQAQLELARHKAQLQDDFIATISHELHTPLGFVKGYTTSLLRSDTTWDQATQKEFLTIIDEESDHLLALIDRMLDSARLQSGSMAMDYQPVRLDSLIRDVVLRQHDRHKSLEVVLDLASAPPIQADSVRLTQVLDNLFENAIKYAPGSKIVVTLQRLENRQVITFSDYGPGIPPEHLQFLFERFYRVPGQARKHGTGLGLFICRQIVQAHNGQISVKTTPGKGTAFRIELPFKRDNFT